MELDEDGVALEHIGAAYGVLKLRLAMTVETGRLLFAAYQSTNHFQDEGEEEPIVDDNEAEGEEAGNDVVVVTVERVFA